MLHALGIHSWEDAIFSLGSLIFIAALLPVLRSPDKPPVRTSLTTGSVLLVYSACYVGLNLWYSLATTALLGAAWIAVGIQKAVGR